MPGPPEMIIIFLLIVVLFGATKLPALGKGLGQGIRNFKKGLSDDRKESGGDSEDSGGQ
jgi:sec-independent protein translocase protein TatA